MIAALRTYLLSKASITDLVGARVFPLLAPQDVIYPLIILQQISTTATLHAEGESGAAEVRMQISCWSETYLGARDLSEKVRLQISGFTGTMGGVMVQDCAFDGAYDQIEPSPGLDGQRHYGITTDYLIWHNRAVPDFSSTPEEPDEP